MQSEQSRIWWATALVLALLLVGAQSATARLTSILPVLVLDSYEVGYDWSDQEIAGVREIFNEAFPGNTVYLEHLDTKKFPRKRHFPLQAKLLAEKYRQIPLAVVIAMDNAALEFALRYRSEIFPRSSIVFCGINDYTPALIAGQANITGVAQAHDSADTIALALKLHPGTKRVVVIHDYTDTGLAMRHEVALQEKRFSPVIISDNDDLPIEELQGTLKHLPRDSIVVMLSYTVDKTGRTFTQAEAARLISGATDVPVYGVHAAQLGHGVVGGLMMGGEAQGSAAARMAVRILQGESASAIPVNSSPMSQPMFDYRLLRRFDISAASLPLGATIINRPPPFYELHKGIFWGGIVALIILATFVVALSWAIFRRKQVEGEIRRLNTELEERVQRRTTQLEVANAALQQEISCRQQAQEEISGLNADLLRQKTALETINKELESFSYSVSHDLRAPLRHIASFSTILLQDYGDRLDAEGRNLIERTVAGCKRMARLIDELLALARISRAAPRFERVDLSAMADQILNEFREEDADRRVQFTVASGMTLWCDPTLMQVVMENLLGNAWKYTKYTAHAQITVGSRRDGGKTVYFVSDNGAGFDMRYADKLFGAFQRLHSAAEYDGTGVGLATVQRIIHRHGGSIWAESELGKGATFYFSLG